MKHRQESVRKFLRRMVAQTNDTCASHENDNASLNSWTLSLSTVVPGSLLYFLRWCVLESHGTVAASVRRMTVFGGAGQLFELDLSPEPDEVVESPQVAVLVVPLHPGGAVVDRHSLGEGDRLPKVDEMDAAHVSAVVDKQERTANHLRVMRRTNN